MLNVGSIVIRVDDLESQKEFWTKALDYVPREGDDADFALLRPRDGVGPMSPSIGTPPRFDSHPESTSTYMPTTGLRKSPG